MGAGPEGVQGDVMTFDVFPNRPDLYSVEGIARGLRGFLDLEVGLPVYHLESSGIEFVVDHSVADVRPFAVGGIVRGLELEDALLRSLVDLQEKLHLTVGRHRKKVAIGIHDMDKVTPPYTYKAVLPEDVRFTPLGMAEELDLRQILSNHEEGREYAHLVTSKPRFLIITASPSCTKSTWPRILRSPPDTTDILEGCRDGRRSASRLRRMTSRRPSASSSWATATRRSCRSPSPRRRTASRPRTTW